MRLDQPTVATLREFVPEQDLRAARIATGRPWRWLPRLIGMSAITFAPVVVFRAGRYQPNTPKGLALIAHEVLHIGQVRELGRVRFYWRYLLGQLRCGFRHDRHPMEVPCIERQREIRRALEARSGGGAW
ncbi:MAG: hypothetical protein AMXMBFR80_05580 [Dehalococcoidia bacterium]|nr:DUF4157 domain-containing protein [Tepidiformaceae bacterium]